MATAAGLFSHQMTAGQVLTHNTATPMDSSTSGTSGTSSSDDSSDSSTTISANDFLTLLVTEMQNQDPTADTDPNEYINQLVNVNSLEQLIDINQTLTTDLGSTSSTSSGGTSGQAIQEISGASGSATTPSSAASPRAAVSAAASSLSSTSGSATSSASTPQTSSIFGNLSAPHADPAAERVGHALTRRTHAAAVD